MEMGDNEMEILEKVREAINQNRPYVVFPLSVKETLTRMFGSSAIFEYTSKGTTYAILNLFKTSIPFQQQSSNGVKILPVDYRTFLPEREELKYVPQHRELDILEVAMESEQNVLFVGPKGTGKTLCVAYFAQKHNLPIIQFDCSETTKEYHLIGHYTKDVTGNVVFELGILPLAIEVANQAHQHGHDGAILVLEEINALNPHVQKVLNSLLDWRRHVFVKSINKIYRLENGTKLLIVATMNPSYYSGVFELNEDLRSRFIEYYFNYPKEDKELQIITTFVDVDENLARQVIRLANDTRKAYEAGELSYCLSPRDNINLLKLYKALLNKFNNHDTALKYALYTVLLNRFDPIQSKQELETVKARITEIFGLEV